MNLRPLFLFLFFFFFFFFVNIENFSVKLVKQMGEGVIACRRFERKRNSENKWSKLTEEIKPYGVYVRLNGFGFEPYSRSKQFSHEIDHPWSRAWNRREITASRYTFTVLTTINRQATLFVARNDFSPTTPDVSGAAYPAGRCECSWLWKIPARSFGNLKLLKPIISDDYDEKISGLHLLRRSAPGSHRGDLTRTRGREYLSRLFIPMGPEPLLLACRETRCGIFIVILGTRDNEPPITEDFQWGEREISATSCDRSFIRWFSYGTLRRFTMTADDFVFDLNKIFACVRTTNYYI